MRQSPGHFRQWLRMVAPIEIIEEKMVAEADLQILCNHHPATIRNHAATAMQPRCNHPQPSAKGALQPPQPVPIGDWCGGCAPSRSLRIGMLARGCEDCLCIRVATQVCVAWRRECLSHTGQTPCTCAPKIAEK